jgi:ketosteroid isomerase-like protein
MSEENVEVVRQAYEAFGRGDLTALVQLFREDVLSYTAAPLQPAEHHGHEGLLQWMSDWTEAFDEFAIEALEYVDLGDRVVVGAHQRATGAGSGVPVERDFWLLHRLDKGEIVAIGIYDTKAQALGDAAS